MSSDEDQQALAWQQIIKNRAFHNVRMQQDESWVDAACRTLDELLDQKEQAEKSLEDFISSQLNTHDDKFTQLDEARIEANIQRNKAQREAESWRSHAKNLEAEVTELQDQLEFKARIERVSKGDMTFEEVKRAIESVKVLDQSRFAQFAAEAVMHIMADPAALVIRESQIDNVEVTSIDDGRFWLGDDALINVCTYPTAEEVRESLEHLLASAAEAEAVARAIDNGVSSEDKRVEALAEIIGDFAIADEHSGERNDKQLARLLISRGVTVDE